MAFSVADQPISGDDMVDFGVVRQILFWAVDTIDLGLDVHEVDIPSGYLYKLGWVSLGDRFSIDSSGSLWYWREPIRLAFAQNLWTPNATSYVGGPAGLQLASGIRWHLSTGTNAHLFVLADS